MALECRHWVQTWGGGDQERLYSEEWPNQNCILERTDSLPSPSGLLIPTNYLVSHRSKLQKGTKMPWLILSFCFFGFLNHVLYFPTDLAKNHSLLKSLLCIKPTYCHMTNQSLLVNRLFPSLCMYCENLQILLLSGFLAPKCTECTKWIDKIQIIHENVKLTVHMYTNKWGKITL